ncbi:MAG: hypothetical protein ACI841_001640 [Planctomycetota bacterium]|jgi:hypothetical protein
MYAQKIRRGLLAGAALVLSTQLASAQVVNYVTYMDGAQQGTASPAVGSGTFVIDTVADTMTYSIEFSGLTAIQTAGHLHGLAAAGNNGAVLHGLQTGSPVNGVWNYPPSFEANILNGEVYVNIHTQAFAPGEIRGQIVPEPVTYCTCDTAAPCGNTTSVGGCENSSGAGSQITTRGLSSIVIDSLELVANNIPLQQPGIFFMGMGAPMVPFGDGHRCVGGTTFRFPAAGSGASQVLTLGPGIAASTASNPASGQIQSGQTWNFQCWFRDPQGPCGNGWNLSDAVAVTWVP